MKMDLDKMKDIPWYWFVLIVCGGVAGLIIYLWSPEDEDRT